MRLSLIVLVTMATSLNIVAQRQLTLNNTTAGGIEYSKIRPRHANVIYDSNNKLIIQSENESAWDSIKQIKYHPTIYPNTNGYERSDKSGNIAYTQNGKLFVLTCSDSTTVEILSADGRVVGEAVHRNEFGINKGLFWSKNGDKLAYYEMDESMVSEYPIVDISQRIATTKPIRYPMAGETSHRVKVKIYDTKTKDCITLDTEMKGDSYFTNIAWRPDGKCICIAEINRTQNEMHFNIYNTENGSLITTLFTEKDNRWIEPCHPAYFIDNDNFVWLSDRDGYTHIYHYNINTRKCQQLTSGPWCVCQIYGYSPKPKSFTINLTNEVIFTKTSTL